MPRKARVEFLGAVYHLLDRGDRQEAIFLDDTDREQFLATLGQACERTGWRSKKGSVLESRQLGEARENNFIAGSGERRATTYMRYPNGSVSDVQYPDGLSIHRDYISRGQLKSVSDGRTAAPVVDYMYLPDGKVDHSILADGTRTD